MNNCGKRELLFNPSYGTAAIVTMLFVGLLPFAASSKESEALVCSTIGQTLPEVSVLPDGSREGRLSLGRMSITARDRIPGVLCTQECLLTLRLADGKLEKHHFAGPNVLSRSIRLSPIKAQPRLRRVRYFRLRDHEWISVGVSERRLRAGRILYEDVRVSVYLVPPYEDPKDIHSPDQSWIDLKWNVAACLDRF